MQSLGKSLRDSTDSEETRGEPHLLESQQHYLQREGGKGKQNLTSEIQYRKQAAKRMGDLA